MLRLVKGQIIASIWPKKRPNKPTERQRIQRDSFAAIVDTVKHLSTVETQTMQDAIEAWNQTHQGFSGSEAIRPEDWHQARLSGRAFALTLPDGRTVYSAAVARDVSLILDWIEPRHGGLLVRGKDEWCTTDNCAAGYKFTVTPDGVLPLCCGINRLATPSESVES
jgi:hypothetical protein